MRRAALLLLLVGCAGAPRSDRDTLVAIMGRNDHHKLQIQYATAAPDARLNEHVAAIETGIEQFARLRPFGDRRDDLVPPNAARALSRLRELRDARWTKANIADNWRRLETICADCHKALERR